MELSMRQLEIFNGRYEKLLQLARWNSAREPGIVYNSVLTLRHAGFRVYRDGHAAHLVDGERIDNLEIIYRANLVRLHGRSKVKRHDR
jgi:hypothetical protein